MHDHHVTRSTGALSFVRSHPNPALRIPALQTDATLWRFQHPG